MVNKVRIVNIIEFEFRVSRNSVFATTISGGGRVIVNNIIVCARYTERRYLRRYFIKINNEINHFNC